MPILIDRPGKLRADEVDCILIRDLREVLDLLEIASAPENMAAWQERKEMNT